MTDIVERLRGKERAPCDATEEEALDCREGACNCDWKTRQEAADEIERLRDALHPLYHAASGISFGEDWNNGTHAKLHGYRQKLIDALPAARAALGEGK